MYYTAKIESFNDLYDMFIADEAGVILAKVQDWHLEDIYMEWLTEYFDGRLPMRQQIAYAIMHKWHEFRLHIPFLPLAEFKVEVNVSDTKAYVITVMKDFREVFEEREEQKNA